MESIGTIIMGAFILVISLAWRDFFQTFFDKVIPEEEIGNKLIAKFAYALIVTSVALLIYMFM